MNHVYHGWSMMRVGSRAALRMLIERICVQGRFGRLGINPGRHCRMQWQLITGRTLSSIASGNGREMGFGPSAVRSVGSSGFDQPDHVAPGPPWSKTAETNREQQESHMGGVRTVCLSL